MNQEEISKNSQLEVDELDKLLTLLFPITRSLTGEGNRETLRIAGEVVPLRIIEYPSGTAVYDWTIPDEWSIRDAYVKKNDGTRIVDYQKNNLHVVGYSSPIEGMFTFDELRPHLHVLKENCEGIPYRTAYYKREWGFCVSAAEYRELSSIKEPLEVKIDSDFNSSGSMTLAELVVPGKCSEEYLISTYFCHPSMANDNLSGFLLALFLARGMLRDGPPRKSWRLVFVPETIGAIAYLKHNETVMKEIVAGLVATTCGGPGPLGFKESFIGEHHVDRAVSLAFRDHGIDPLRYRFAPDGSDERQYSSPGFRIPVASITKDKYYEYPQYHTSMDDLSFVNGSQIQESLGLYREVIRILDHNETYLSTNQFGEPQLSRHNLYPVVGGAINQIAKSTAEDRASSDREAIMWNLFFADGNHDLLTIAEKSRISFERISDSADVLVNCGLLSNSSAKF